jgi:hypothetical protein
MGREGQKIAGEHRDPQLAAAWREVCVSLSVFTYICMYFNKVIQLLATIVM